MAATLIGTRDPKILDVLLQRPGWMPEKVLARLSGYPNPDACWTWTGALLAGRYGYVGLPKAVVRKVEMVLTHRTVWLALRGPIPDGYVLDHDGPNGCKNRACANPNHLQVVTSRHNTVATGSSVAAEAARKTHCPAGHALTEGNLTTAGRVQCWRQCLTCGRTHARAQGRAVMAAARALGLKRAEYGALHGWSMETALRLAAATN